MFCSKRLFIVVCSVLILLLAAPATNVLPQKKTDQIDVEASFIEITHTTGKFFGIELKLLGPETGKITEVSIDICPEWNSDSRFLTIPEGWKRLNTKRGDAIRLLGPGESFPLKMELISRLKIPAIITQVELKQKKRKLRVVKNISLHPMKLHVMPTQEIIPEPIRLKVNVKRANIRSKPGLKGNIITSASQGEIIRSDKELNNWFRVLLPSEPDGIKKYGYIHSRIVEEVKQAVKEVPVEIPEVKVKPAKKEQVPVAKEPRKIKSEPLIKRLLKKASVKVTAGPGFFMNGMGDLEKLRTETEDFITAMGQAAEIPGSLNMKVGDPTETDPGYQTTFNWDPLRFNTHFQAGFNVDISPKLSAGLSVGRFGAGNDNIDYSFTRECQGENQWWSWNETDSTRFTESYDLSATPVYATLNYCSNPRYTNGKFSPEFSIGIGPIFGNIKRTFTEDMEFKRDINSTGYQSSSDQTQMSRNMTGTYHATGLGIQLSGGIDYQISPIITVGLDGFFNFATFGDWTGSEEGSWNSRIQRSTNGEVFQDDRDSGNWSFEDMPLYYYYASFVGIDQPFMFVCDQPPLNGVSPSINWNSWGIQLTFKISLGGKPAPADVPEVTDTPDPSGDPGTNPTDTPPPTIYGEDLETEEKVWNAYVYIGSLKGAEFNRTAIVAAADEAKDDFEEAGYNVIPNHNARLNDFKTVMNDPHAKAFWFAGHGQTLKGKPFAQILDIEGNGISPTITARSYRFNTDLLFKKPGLNQVTIHACKQDLPEWYVAFSDARYISWMIKIKGIYVYWWQKLHVYPKINPETGEEESEMSAWDKPIFK